MFLIDKYYKNYNDIISQTFDFKQFINNNNFQHMIFYGLPESNKEYLINKLLEMIYEKHEIELHNIEYSLNGYSNNITNGNGNGKIIIKQSKNHIVIEPNSNGCDKFLIQNIIPNYAKSNILNIFTKNVKFKIIIINKIYNLSFYTQTALRKTMEKYSDTCKFILITNQLTQIIEPIKSKCLLFRVPLPTYENILESVLYISNKENININISLLNHILNISERNINYAIWLLDFYKYKLNYNQNWKNIIDNIVTTLFITNKDNLHIIIKKLRNYFYILFITNIPIIIIIKNIMIKLINHVILSNNNKLKYEIINITSKIDERMIYGTRYIIHFEAYMIKIIDLFYKYNIY